jgi:hypothetical protein
MIRCLYPAPIPEGSWLRSVFHPDPDYLSALTTRFYRTERDRIVPQASDFSEIVSSIRIGRTHKLTRPSRLQEVTSVLCGHLSRADREALDFLDVGASDGITSLETLRTLRKQLGSPVRVCALDPFVRLLKYRAGAIVEYRAPNQSPVMVRIGPIGLQLSSLDSSRDPISRFLGAWYARCAALRQRMRLVETISLIHPMVAKEPDILVLEQDILRHDPGLRLRFDVARASNVLNYSYFSRAQIADAIAHLHAYLRPHGLLLISRSSSSDSGERDHGSIWRKDDDRFVHVQSIGTGAEVRDQVERYRTRDHRSHDGI